MSPADLSPAAEIPWRDRTWIMRRPKIETEVLFQKYLERNALGGVLVNADILGDNGALMAMQAVSRDCAAGVYRWGRPMWAACLADDKNLTHLFWLVLTQEAGQKALRLTRGERMPPSVPAMDEFFKEKRAELIEAYNTLTAPAEFKQEKDAAPSGELNSADFSAAAATDRPT